MCSTCRIAVQRVLAEAAFRVEEEEEEEDKDIAEGGTRSIAPLYK